MARRFGGTYSPGGNPDGGSSAGPRVDPVGARANLLFVPAIPLVATCLGNGAISLTLALVGAGVLTLAAWLLREGLVAQAAFAERKIARAPALPRKMLASLLTGIGTALGVAAHQAPDLALLAPVLFGLCAGGLHVAAFGIDPLRGKGLAGVDTFQQDRVARVVQEAERLLTDMTQAVARAGDRTAVARVAAFQTTARDLIRTVEEDPRDLTAARKYLSVYLRGARDATVKFADIHARSQDAQARRDYLALLDDLDENFAARSRKLLLEDRGDLTVEIEVLRDRLSREGVRLDLRDAGTPDPDPR